MKWRKNSRKPTATTEELSSRIQRFELVDALANFVSDLRYDDLSAQSVSSAQTFIMDTIAVGVAGKTYNATDKALAAAQAWGEGSTRVIGRPGVALPRPSAAFVNGMQIHALEWDALHEPSVVIAMCVPIAAMVAELDSQAISGQDLILATVLAVEVAVFFGGETSQGPQFFRPATAGGMGAAAALAKLRGFDKTQIIHALGLAHAQTAGTMQAHWEGSMALPMQIGNAARMAHLAVDMVEAGMTGPVDFIDGRFGYFRLFERSGGIEALLTRLGTPFKITEMAHKPYPAGRATQAALTMVRELRDQHSFDIEQIEAIEIQMPALSVFLVGRPPEPDMTPSYARLCLRFVVPLMLRDGGIDPRQYQASVFADPVLRSIGDRMQIVDDGNPDKNALGPQQMQIRLTDGRTLESHCDAPIGSPDNPLSENQCEDKVRHCLELGWDEDSSDTTKTALNNANGLIDAARGLAATDNARVLLDLVS